VRLEERDLRFVLRTPTLRAGSRFKNADFRFNSLVPRRKEYMQPQPAIYNLKSEIIHRRLKHGQKNFYRQADCETQAMG